MIRTALLALALAITASAAAHAAQPEQDGAATEQVRTCHPIFVTCPQEPGVVRGLALLDKHIAPTPLREETETAFA